MHCCSDFRTRDIFHFDFSETADFISRTKFRVERGVAPVKGGPTTCLIRRMYFGNENQTQS